MCANLFDIRTMKHNCTVASPRRRPAARVIHIRAGAARGTMSPSIRIASQITSLVLVFMSREPNGRCIQSAIGALHRYRTMPSLVRCDSFEPVKQPAHHDLALKARQRCSKAVVNKKPPMQDVGVLNECPAKLGQVRHLSKLLDG
ncbi:hypothetical protein A5724_12680 [Mycobacterium sp. ACS1612]|nr:hypothetical protein A5724_12680 [Mycobacterium sp. ACS1612]